ncbi:MAG TPA: hypothetical protein VGQ09_23010 [Chitinophagaceae bacterium]|jgi:hypothetical protein|nr:hypothetical protein [Chitinophagaceae bacterium]
MKKLLKSFLPISILLSFLTKTNAQGCSDAGICTLHSIKNNTKNKNAGDYKPNALVFELGFGKGEDDISYFTPSLEYTRQLTKLNSFTAKLDFSYINGHLANVAGLGDLFLSLNHQFDTKKLISKSVIIGLKIPFDHAGLSKNNIHLPMPYQTSLGTFDFIAGFNFFYKSFGATLAWQQPLTKSNRNEFLPSEYPSNSYAQEYLPSNQFGRKADALIRLSYNRDVSKRFSVRPSLLGIYHLANDTYLNESKLRKEIPDSKGLTLNGNLFFNFKMNKRGEFEIALGTPFIVRDARPDGLTRSFVSSLEYKIGF